MTDDVRVGFVHKVHVAEVHEATELVRGWLDELLKSGREPRDPSSTGSDSNGP